MTRNIYSRLVLIATPMMMVACAWIGYTLWRQRDDALAAAARNNAYIASVLAEQASQSLRAIDIALDELTERYSAFSKVSDSDLKQEMGTKAVFDFLTHRLGYLPKAEVISIHDSEGKFIASTRGWPAPNASIGGRVHFEYLKNNVDHSLVVNLSLPSVISGEQTIYFNRRLENKHGEFVGIVGIGVRPEYFLTLYDSIASIPGAFVWLVRSDGSLVAEYPKNSHATHSAPANDNPSIVVDKGVGSLRSANRLLAVQPLERYAMAVSVGVSEALILDEWWSHARASGLQSLLFAFVVITLICALLNQYWRADAARDHIRLQATKLATANYRFDAVLNNMSQGVAMFDSDKRLVIHNRSYMEMYGLSADAIPPGTHFTKVIELRVTHGIQLQGDPETYRQKLLARVSGDEHQYATMIDHLSDGRYIMISHQPTSDGGWITTHEDITERHSATVEQCGALEALVQTRTAEIRQKTEELRIALRNEHAALKKQKAVNEQQRNFISMASHEFRTPLAIIDSAAQKLQRRAREIQPTDIVTRADTIRRSVQRITGLMEDVLSAAKFEDGAINLSVSEADLFQVVLDCCYRHFEVSAKHRLRIDLDTLPRCAMIDAKALDQVMTNLIANAIKYSPDAGFVDIRGQMEGGRARIDVEDFGVGIDADDLPKMFTRFFRAKTATGIAGTGIGLSVVKLIVEMHGGEVSITSVKGKGSTFTIYLPISTETFAIQNEDKDASLLASAA